MRILVLVAAVSLGACASQPPPPEVTPQERVPEQPTQTRDREPDIAPEPQPLPEPIPDPLDTKIFYFDFDRSEVRAEDRSIVAAHAAHLRNNPGMRVRIEGHADERGSREYNIGLGERRSQAVKRMLKLGGSGESQLTTISYGEEKPARTGHDEYSWQENRRVELVYSN